LDDLESDSDVDLDWDDDSLQGRSLEHLMSAAHLLCVPVDPLEDSYPRMSQKEFRQHLQQKVSTAVDTPTVQQRRGTFALESSNLVLFQTSFEAGGNMVLLQTSHETDASLEEEYKGMDGFQQSRRGMARGRSDETSSG